MCSVFHKFSAFIRISEQMKDLDFFLQKQMQFQAEIVAIFWVKNQFHTQQRYLANVVNYCTTNPSFGKKLKIMIYYFHYNKKKHFTSNHMHIDLVKNSCKVVKRSM